MPCGSEMSGCGQSDGRILFNLFFSFFFHLLLLSLLISILRLRRIPKSDVVTRTELLGHYNFKIKQTFQIAVQRNKQMQRILCFNSFFPSYLYFQIDPKRLQQTKYPMTSRARCLDLWNFPAWALLGTFVVLKQVEKKIFLHQFFDKQTRGNGQNVTQRRHKEGDSRHLVRTACIPYH